MLFNIHELLLLLFVLKMSRCPFVLNLKFRGMVIENMKSVDETLILKKKKILKM